MPVCVVAAGLAGLAGCGDRGGDVGGPIGRRPEPVELILMEDGRPDPAVLAERQVVFRGNGEEPETLDPHRAVGVRLCEETVESKRSLLEIDRLTQQRNGPVCVGKLIVRSDIDDRNSHGGLPAATPLGLASPYGRRADLPG